MTRNNCTLCGGFRALRQPEFNFHIASQRHRLAVHEFDLRHQAMPQTHHDGHVALHIACTCASRAEQKAEAA